MPTRIAALGLFALLGASFGVSQFIRTAPAVLAPELRRELGLSPEMLGLVFGLFFAAFTLVHLPVGALLDRHGPRRVMCLMLLLSASGTFVAGQYGYLDVKATPIGAGKANATATASLTVPAGATYVGVSDPNWQCTITGTRLDCTVPTTAASTATLEFLVDAGAGSTLSFQPAGTSSGPAAEIDVVTDTAVVFARRLHGSVAVTGNTVLTCDGVGSCPQARLGNAGVNNRRQNQTMQYVSIDGADPAPASRAQLDIPAGATVEKAVLSWSANLVAGSGGVAAPDPAKAGTVTLTGPEGTSTVDADDVIATTDAYYAVADVTALVSSGGMFTVADLQAATGNGRYGGWTLTVAYSDPSLPLADVGVRSEFQSIFGSTPVSVVLTGLTAGGSSRLARLVWSSYEGDRSIVGEAASLDGIALSNAANPADDVFGSSLADVERAPADVNSFGIDTDTFDVDLPAGASDLTLSITTPNDRVKLGVIGWAVRR